VLARLDRVASAGVAGGSGRGNDRVDRKGLGRWEVLEAMELLMGLESMSFRIRMLSSTERDQVLSILLHACGVGGPGSPYLSFELTHEATTDLETAKGLRA
jgi:hypothetical protein